MSDEQDKLKVSLEPPKLFGRKKKAGKKGDTGSASEQTEPAPTPAEHTESAPEPNDASGEEPSTTEMATEDRTEHAAFAPPEAAAEAEPEVTDAPEVAADPEAAAEPDPEPETVTEPEPGAPEPAAPATAETSVLPPVADDEPIIDEIETGLDEDEDEDDLAPATPAPAAAPAGPSLATRLRERLSSLAPKKSAGEDAPDAPTMAEPEDDAGSGGTVPMLDHYPAAVLTGAIVGLGMVALTWLSLRGCEAIRGTATCGGGPGFLLLVAMFIVSVMLGSAILKSFEVPDPGSSSFLAVGLVAVVALLLLIDALDHWSMLLVIPVISIGAYALSVFVTKTFVEPEA